MRPHRVALLLLVPVLACASAASPATPRTPSVSRYDGPIIDVHAHFRTGPDDGLAPTQPIGVDALRALEERAGVTRAGLIVIARAGAIEDTRRRNDAVIAAALASAGFFFAIASVHPADGEAALAELDRLAAAGVRVIKLHPNTQRFDVAGPELAAVVERAAALGLVLLFDAYSPFDADEIGKFLLLAVQHPNARLVLAHMGAVRFHELAVFGMVRRFAWYPNNVWFDLSVVAAFYANSPYRDELSWVIRAVGVDHVLFGSDWPVDEPATAVEAVRRLGLDIDEQRQIFHDNAAALLGSD